MKKYLLFLIIFISAITQLKATDWFPVGAKWYWSTWCLNADCAYYTVEITKDTIVDSKVFKKGEFMLFDELTRDGIVKPESTILFQQENGKINYRFRDTTYRLYDFNLNIGDTMYTDMTLLCNNFASGVVPVKDTILVAKSIVDSINTIIISGVMLKQLFMHSYYDTANVYYWDYFKGMISFSPFSIIEKIGAFSTLSFFGNVTNGPVMTGGTYGKLRCYEDNEINYHRYNNIACDTLTRTLSNISKNKTEDEIKLFPNPATNKIEIEYKVNKNNKSASIILMDIQGNILYNIESENKLQLPALDVSSFANGMYFLKISIDDEFIVEPVIVQH